MVRKILQQLTRAKNTPKTTQYIAIASGKGGVGKSSVTCGLASFLQHQGYQVGVIDADVYGPCQPAMFGIKQLSNIDKDGTIHPVVADNGVSVVSVATLIDMADTPIVWRAPIANKLIMDLLQKVKFPKTLDYILIDLPPGTGDIQLTLAQKANLSGAIVVTTPQKVACEVSVKAVELFVKVQIPVIGLINNMAHFVCSSCDAQTNIFGNQHVAKIQSKYQLDLLADIPLSRELAELADLGQTPLELPRAEPCYQAYQQLVQQFLPKAQKLKQLTPKTQIEVIGRNVKLRLQDQEKILPIKFLREQCQCALCVDELTGAPLLDKSTIACDISIEKYEYVGSYGVQFYFTDGHHTGIYTFDILKNLKLKPTFKNTMPLELSQVQDIFNATINQQIASHKGFIKAMAIKGDTLEVEMQGGCQGCAQSTLTLKTGVKQVVQRHFPQLQQVTDITEHAAGENPYYSKI